MIRQMLALATLVALVGSAYGQNFTRVAAFKNRFLGCVQADTRYQYCSDGECYNGAAPSSVTCTKDFDGQYDNPIYPSTYSYDYNIDKLDIVELPIVANQNWLLLNRGETLRMTFKSVTEKSAYVDLFYNNVNGGNGDNLNKTANQQVQFLVFNNRLKSVRKFDVSRVDKVLLPQSADTFTVYMAARGSNFNITVQASNSMIGKVLGFAAAMIAMVAMMF